jgi:hypothetical protein
METLTKRQVGQTPSLLWATAVENAKVNRPVYVLEKGIPAYRVEYVLGQVDPLAELARSGELIKAPRRGKAWPATPGGPRYTDDEAASLISAMKGEN